MQTQKKDTMILTELLPSLGIVDRQSDKAASDGITAIE
jgi:hypothetical protein